MPTPKGEMRVTTTATRRQQQTERYSKFGKRKKGAYDTSYRVLTERAYARCTPAKALPSSHCTTARSVSLKLCRGGSMQSRHKVVPTRLCGRTRDISNHIPPAVIFSEKARTSSRIKDVSPSANQIEPRKTKRHDIYRALCLSLF